MATGRLAFLLFFPAYVGGALTALFGDLFLPVRKRAREFGLAFAAAILVHLGLVVCLSIIRAGPSAGTFAIFGPAAAFTLLLACLSFSRVRRLLPDKVWRPIRAVATNYIAFAFLYDFAHFPSSKGHLTYLPFAALAIVGPLLKLAAWAKAVGSVALNYFKILRAQPIKASNHI
jgi:hypothetical protein